MERLINPISFKPLHVTTYLSGYWVAGLIILVISGLPYTVAAYPDWRRDSIKGELSHPNQTEVTLLNEETRIQREMKGGETHPFQVELVRGQFFYAVVEQKGIDVEVTIKGPDGQPIATIDSPNGAQGPEPVLMIAEVSGSYRVEISSDKKSVAGRYEVQVLRIRVATNKDRELITGHRYFQEGYYLQRQGTATSIQSAISKFEQSLPLFHSTENSYWEAFTAFTLASTYLRTGDYQKALPNAETALALFRSISLKNREARALNLLGRLNDTLGEYPKARSYYREALLLAQTLKDQTQQGSILINLGKIHSDLGDLQEALDYYNQALSIYRVISDKLSEGIAQHNIGVVYYLTGDFPKALEQLTQALATRREVKDKRGEADTLSEIGYCYRNLGKPREALEHFNQALSIRKAVGDANGEAFDLNSVSLIYAGLGEADKSLDLGLQALEKIRAIGNRRYEALITNNLGYFYALKGQQEKAVDYYQRALSIFGTVQDKRNTSRALIGLARAEQSRGNIEEAVKNIREAISYIEQVREGVGNYQQLRTSYLASTQEAYQLYIDLLMQQHRLTPLAGNDGLALEICEKSRSRSLLDMLVEGKADIRRGVDPALLEQERSLVKLLNAKSQLQIKLNDKSGSHEQLSALNREIAALEDEHQRVQAAIRKASPRYAAITQPQPLSLKQIQQQVLGKDVLLLEYKLGEERSYLWAVTAETITSYELPNRELIRKAAERVTELLTARSTRQRVETPQQRAQRIAEADAQLPEAAKQLSEMVLAPAAAKLGGTRLLIVPDGPLQYVPFAMLPVANPIANFGASVQTNSPQSAPGNGRNPQSVVPLVVQNEITTLPSASALAVMRREIGNRAPAPKMLAVFADPVFTSDDERSKPSAASRTDKSDSNVESKLTAQKNSSDGRSIVHEEKTPAASVEAAGGGRLLIPRLPFTRLEAERILAVAQNSANLKATGFRANRALATGAELSQYRYLHFATHGFLDTEREGLSALVLSLVDEQGKPQEGFLHAHEIYNLNLPAELVVLSACQTGLGKEYKGEGLVGLTRGFMYAGAARVIVSLWNVNDRATAELMPRLYQKMLQEGQRPAAALRSAQIEMWKQKQWQAPYYWAAFVLQGEWK